MTYEDTATATRTFLGAVLQVAILDQSSDPSICSIGSGFFVDGNSGLIVASAHSVFRMDAEACGGDENLRGTLQGSTRAVIGVIPDGGEHAQFRYIAELVSHDWCNVDACVLRITHRFVSDFYDIHVGADRPCRAIEGPLSMSEEKLHTLKLTLEDTLGLEVQTAGFDQSEGGGKRICSAVQLVPGVVCVNKYSYNNSYSQSAFPFFCPRGGEILVKGEFTKNGHSGGPCINSNGRVVGILSRSKGEYSFIVPASEISPLVNSLVGGA